MKERIAVIVQRWTPEVVGGSERNAMRIARYLEPAFKCELLTTTASDAESWRNELPSGVEIYEGMLVRRFPVIGERGSYWRKLHAQMTGAFREFEAGDSLADAAAAIYSEWSVAAQLEWLRAQGPYSPELADFLYRNRNEYRAFIYVTYLYAPTYFGMETTPPSRNLLAPTLHNEPVAYLPIFGAMVRRARALIFHSDAEGALAQRLWGACDHLTLPVGIDQTPALSGPLPSGIRAPYLLYSGRLDAGKGLPGLIDACNPLKGTVQLVLTGEGPMHIQAADWLRNCGFVSDELRRQLMAQALAFIMPSVMESFSIASLEAMAQGTPLIALRASAVLREHVERSGGGLLLDDWSELGDAVHRLLAAPDWCNQLGARGRKYVADQFDDQRAADLLVGSVRQWTRPLKG
ncbi:MAG: glycosyltransferase family 4 protein [Leptospirales bacterium]|nr:glycosyltransferase family 4 protein [Leptospirales bacterium]